MTIITVSFHELDSGYLLAWNIEYFMDGAESTGAKLSYVLEVWVIIDDVMIFELLSLRHDGRTADWRDTIVVCGEKWLPLPDIDEFWHEKQPCHGPWPMSFMTKHTAQPACQP